MHYRRSGADGSVSLMLSIGTLLVLPLAALLVMALVSFDGATMMHLVRTVLVESVVTSALLVTGTVAGAVCVGVGCAWAIERYQFPGRNVLGWLLVLPLAMPTYVIAYAYTDLLQYSGPVQRWLRLSLGFEGRLPDVRSLWAAVILFAFVLYPYVYLMTRTALRDLSQSSIDSARLLGLRPRRVFRRIVLPLTMPAITAGAILVMMETLADVGATFYFGLQTFSAGIYRAWYGLGNRGAALMLAAALLATVAVIFWFDSRARRRVERTTSRTHRPWPPLQLERGPGIALAVLLSVPVLIGFVIPVFVLVRLLVGEPELTMNLTRFWGWTRNSLVAGMLGACAVLLLSAGFVYARRFASPRRIGRLDTITTGLRFGYAVPGAVIALVILWPVAVIDRTVTDWLGLASPMLSGTVAALVYAYALRFFAVGHGGLEAAMQRVTPSLDSAARSLGSTRWAVFRRVHLPLLLRPALVAWMLVLIDVMKELPATLMLRPFNFDTLAVIAQQLASDERLAEAALPSFAIVALGLIPVLLVSTLMNQPAGAARTATVDEEPTDEALLTATVRGTGLGNVRATAS